MTEPLWITKEEYEQLRQFKSLSAEPYMKVKPCPTCEGTKQVEMVKPVGDNFIHDHYKECNHCLGEDGQPTGWVIA